MDVIKQAITRTLPTYLGSLPLPDTFEGWATLNQHEWATLAPFIVTLLTVVYLTTYLLAPPKQKKIPVRRAAAECSGHILSRWLQPAHARTHSAQQVNHSVKKTEAKVVDFCYIDDIEDSGKKVLCRCWKSKTFPYCDGAHVKHNETTGDSARPWSLCLSFELRAIAPRRRWAGHLHEEAASVFVDASATAADAASWTKPGRGQARACV